jgi:hypothetical protein
MKSYRLISCIVYTSSKGILSPHSRAEQATDLLPKYNLRGAGRVVVVAPEVARAAVARRIDEPVLGRAVQDRRERRVRVVQPRRHAGVVCLERGRGGGELLVKVGDDNLLGGSCRCALRKHERRAVDGRHVDEEEVTGAEVAFRALATKVKSTLMPTY